jgi:hypothetical protein
VATQALVHRIVTAGHPNVLRAQGLLRPGTTYAQCVTWSALRKPSANACCIPHPYTRDLGQAKWLSGSGHGTNPEPLMSTLVRSGHSAMSAQCPLCPKGDMRRRPWQSAARHIRFDSGHGVLHLWRPMFCVPFPTSASLACRAASSGRRPAAIGFTKSSTMASGFWRGAAPRSAAFHPQWARLDRTLPAHLRRAKRAQGHHMPARRYPGCGNCLRRTTRTEHPRMDMRQQRRAAMQAFARSWYKEP